jgi:hypothetical protein
MLGTDVADTPQTVEYCHLLGNAGAVVQEFAGAREYPQSFLRRHPFYDADEPAESQMQVEFLCSRPRTALTLALAFPLVFAGRDDTFRNRKSADPSQATGRVKGATTSFTAPAY